MPRQIISKDDLLRLINEKLQSLDECRNLMVNSIAADPARANGANWTTYGLRRSGPDHDEIACREAVRAFMDDLQRRYDIA